MLHLISYNVPVGVAVLGHPSIEFPKTFPQRRRDRLSWRPDHKISGEAATFLIGGAWEI